jgi:hypothetical protein
MAYCIPLLWKRLPSDMNKQMCIVARGGFPELGVELIVPHCKTVLLQTCQQDLGIGQVKLGGIFSHGRTLPPLWGYVNGRIILIFFVWIYGIKIPILWGCQLD